jgi:tRNA threonylcarbamoyladenosine biosynthesis protein TsaB
MTAILAIDAATDACSVAIYRDGSYQERHEVAPRQHSQRLFGMLRELLPSGNLREQGVEAIAYGCGPGSFTGLRIAASAVQGLAYTNQLPAVAVSSLACQVQAALRMGEVESGDLVLSLLDARIKEVYYAIYAFENGLPVLREGPHACAPDQVIAGDAFGTLRAVGDGCAYLQQLPAKLRTRLVSVAPAVLPTARDLIPLALDALASGRVQLPAQVQPVYVRDEINWKKLAEQGKAS